MVAMVQGTFVLGEAKGEAQALLAVLRTRGIAVPEAVRQRILGERDPKRIERWVVRAVVAASVDEVMDEPQQAG
jgi:hypothetical protein